MPEQDILSSLPIEVLLEIFAYLSPEAIAKAARVNKKLSITAKNNLFWQEKFKRHFPHLSIELSKNINWYDAFRNAYDDEYKIYNKKDNTYKILSTNIRKLFSLVKEEDIASLDNQIKLEDLNQVDKNGFSLLDWAKKKNNQQLLNYFYQLALKAYKSESKTDVKKEDQQKRTILHWAILCHQPESTINSLIQEGADINATCCYQQAIHIACMEGQLETVKLLIEKQPTLLNQRDFGGQTPILWAASRGHAPIVNYLAEKGADLNLQSGNNIIGGTSGYTPLHWASKNGHTEAAKILIENNALLDVTSNNGAHQQAIHIACQKGQLDIVKLLIEKQPTLLNQRDDGGQTPILWAASRGHAPIVNYLAEKGADLNLESNNNIRKTAGYTPLHWASKNGHTEAAKILIENNALLDVTSNNGAHQQAIHIACQKGQLDIVKLLIEAQPTLLNQIDRYGQTPILWAASRGHEPIVSYLAEKGADLNLQSGNNIIGGTSGYTPLHWASKNGHVKTIKILLKNKADIEISDNLNQTPIDVAVKNSVYVNELKLLNYSLKTDRRPDNDFKRSFTIFGHAFKFGGCSAKQKKEAANALKSVIFDGADKSCLDAHQKALNNGELKTIYRSLKIRK